MSREIAQLREENRRLRGELERYRSGETRARLLEVAQEVACEAGFAAEVTEVARRAGISTSTLYRYFASREALIQALVQRSAEEVAQAAAAILGTADPERALRDWMLFGFSMLERWGVLALAISGGMTPDWARGNISPPQLYRFTGHLLKRWRDGGYARPDMNVRSAVRVWFALVAPLRVRGCSGGWDDPRGDRRRDPRHLPRPIRETLTRPRYVPAREARGSETISTDISNAVAGSQ